jgi:putative holliday junction resolvase
LSVRALGIDLGTKRIGVAVSDDGETVATPLTTVQRTRDATAHRTAIARLVDEWEVGVVVVGMPLSLSGADGPAAVAALAEVDELRAALSVPVETFDERLTTVVADQRLRESGVSGKTRAARIDQTAAAVILQDWLDARRGHMS